MEPSEDKPPVPPPPPPPDGSSVDPQADTVYSPRRQRRRQGSGPSDAKGSESVRLRCTEFGEYEILSRWPRAMGIVYRARTGGWTAWWL